MNICASNPVFTVVAAVLWIWSAFTKTPEPLQPGQQKNLFLIFDDIHASLRTQSRRSAWAAIAAASGAILQVLSYLAPICFSSPF